MIACAIPKRCFIPSEYFPTCFLEFGSNPTRLIASFTSSFDIFPAIFARLVTQYIPEIALGDAAQTAAIVVGPPAMMRFSVQGLLAIGLPEENIWVSQERKMCCGLGKCGHCRIGDTYICLDGPVFNYSRSKHLID